MSISKGTIPSPPPLPPPPPPLLRLLKGTSLSSSSGGVSSSPSPSSSGWSMKGNIIHNKKNNPYAPFPKRVKPLIPKPVYNEHSDSTMTARLQRILGLRRQQNVISRLHNNNDDNVEIIVHTYGPDRIELTRLTNKGLNQITNEVPPWAYVQWIDIDGIDLDVIDRLEEVFNIHPLAKLDVINITNRPKLEQYDDQLFVLTTMLKKAGKSHRIISEQVSFFVIGKTVLTIQEGIPGDAWESLRDDLQSSNTKVRHSDSYYLLFSLLSSLVEPCEPLVGEMQDMLQDIELEMFAAPSSELNRRVYKIKRRQFLMRNILTPMKRVASRLAEIQAKRVALLKQQEQEGSYLSNVASAATTSTPYFNDLLEMLLSLVDKLDQQREISTQLNNLFREHQAHRQGEVTYILAIVSVFFLPLTFVAGVYGMNFSVMPELTWEFGYAYVWCVFVFLVIIIFGIFIKIGWITIKFNSKSKRRKMKAAAASASRLSSSTDGSNINSIRRGSISHNNHTTTTNNNNGGTAKKSPLIRDLRSISVQQDLVHDDNNNNTSGGAGGRRNNDDDIAVGLGDDDSTNDLAPSGGATRTVVGINRPQRQHRRNRQGRRRQQNKKSDGDIYDDEDNIGDDDDDDDDDDDGNDDYDLRRGAPSTRFLGGHNILGHSRSYLLRAPSRRAGGMVGFVSSIALQSPSPEEEAAAGEAEVDYSKRMLRRKKTMKELDTLDLHMD